VNAYAERMTEGVEVPPVVLFATNGKHWIGYGWHRLLAAEHVGAPTIAADVRDGGRVAALKYVLGANAAHGHRRSNADKRRCVEIALLEFSQESSRTIAEMCGVGHQLVDQVRGPVDDSSTTRIRSDGRQYPAKRTSKKEATTSTVTKRNTAPADVRAKQISPLLAEGGGRCVCGPVWVIVSGAAFSRICDRSERSAGCQ
jgi:hypothetical protein